LRNWQITVALGRDCLADVAMLCAQPELTGPVASDLVVSHACLVDVRAEPSTRSPGVDPG
jgi:hypothetical protein